jgi:predicted YcjX-like family ATPase
MADNYIQFLSTYQSKFNPKEVLDNPKYVIPDDMKCSEVIDRLKKYIDLTFDNEILPSDEQMMNMFNILERTFNASRDNYVRPLYVSLFHKFDFLENPNEFAKVKFPNFIKAFMKKYELSSPASLKDFIV